MTTKATVMRGGAGGGRGERGFTLLEVMVAISILAVSLVVIFDTNGRGVYMAGSARDMTVATLLARYQMTELEHELFKEGFDDFDEKKDGDFCDQGWCDYRWEAEIRKVEFDTSGIAGMLGDSGGGDDASDPASSLPFDAGIVQTMLPMVQQSLEDAIRRISLTIRWKEGDQGERSFRVDQLLVNLKESISPIQ
jgi:prepilin-type N-terminal cleavage/methylation domain-containing protein